MTIAGFINTGDDELQPFQIILMLPILMVTAPLQPIDYTCCGSNLWIKLILPVVLNSN